MKLHLTGPTERQFNASIKITGSKSESNRSLLLAAHYKGVTIENLSNSDDAQVMAQGLQKTSGTVDIHHAGTAMRFLTGYFSGQEGKNVLLTGSKRMTERPIKILVDALRDLGADISYVNEEGYPPIKINGKALTKDKVSLPANMSSQYISSLLLLAPSLKNGLELNLVGKITSVPYIKMTLGLLDELSIPNSFEGNIIKISPKTSVAPTRLIVESDWSSASYYYSMVALAAVGSEIRLSAYKKNSLQGDSVLVELYRGFGVETLFSEHSITLKKLNTPKEKTVAFDLVNAPDIAQTIAVTTFGLGMECHLGGLHTLKIKETDRLEALHTELTKLGADISVTDKSLTIKPSKTLNKEVAIDTYNDHRMAMAFAPLALKIPLYINDAEVVSKSYPDFWEDLRGLQFSAIEL
ncbi:MAG: 3-phosphoshikimate 1-carboxyvinyltransferase [Maribacter sp.]